MIKKKLEEKLPNDLEVVHKADLVYTVSAREYWQKEILSKEETEIPKLREYVRKFYIKQKRNVLMDHTMEAITIFSLIWSLRANKHAQYQLAKRNHLREIIVQKIADLEKDIKECFLPIEQPLKEGVEEAKKSYKAAIRSILSVAQPRVPRLPPDLEGCVPEEGGLCLPHLLPDRHQQLLGTAHLRKDRHEFWEGVQDPDGHLLHTENLP